MNSKLLTKYVKDAIKVVSLNFDDEIQDRYGFLDGRYNGNSLEVEIQDNTLSFSPLEGTYLQQPFTPLDNKVQILGYIIEDLMNLLPDWMFDDGDFKVPQEILTNYLDNGLSLSEIATAAEGACWFYSQAYWSCPIDDSEDCCLQSCDTSSDYRETWESLDQQIWTCTKHGLSLKVYPPNPYRGKAFANYLFPAGSNPDLASNLKKDLFLDLLAVATDSLPTWFYQDNVQPDLSLSTLQKIQDHLGPEEQEDEYDDEEEDDDWDDDDYRSQDSQPHLLTVLEQAQNLLSNNEPLVKVVEEARKVFEELVAERYGSVEAFYKQLAEKHFGVSDNGWGPPIAPAAENLAPAEPYVSPFTGQVV